MSKNIASYEYAQKNSPNSKELDWFKLIEKKDFKSALDILEKKTELSVLEKLWWIRCQLNLKLLPASTLVSPLEQAYDKITEEHKALAASTYLATCESLINKKQSRLSVLTSKKAFQLLEEQEIAVIYADCLKNEIKEARDKKQTTSYISELESELENLEKDTFNTEYGLEKNKEELEDISRAISEKDTAQEEIAKIAHSKENTKKSFPLAYILAGLLLILLGFSYNFIFTKEQNQLARVDYNIKVPQPLSPKIALPKIDSNLDARELETLEKRKILNNDTKSPNLKILEDVQKRITSLNTNTESIEKANDEEEKEEEVLLSEQEEPISNSTPLEDSEDITSGAKDYSEEIDLEPIPKEKIPNLSPETNSKPELIDQSPKRVESRKINPRLPKASKGIKAYDVREFDPPLKYKTITSTEVLSSPSLLSNSLARLKLDTHVQVIRKIGLWLEIRSTQGRIGYIYAQDASKL